MQTKPVDAVVVGAGLFGSVIAAALQHKGLDVIGLDDHRPDAGSPPAACLIKPSWVSSMDKTAFHASLDLLDRLFGVHNMRFKLGPMATTVHFCEPGKILRSAIVSRVVAIQPEKAGYELFMDSGSAVRAKRVVLAAGVWTEALFPQVAEAHLSGLAGVAYLWPQAAFRSEVQPFIRPWAPYKQLVAFDRGDGIWVGDGSAIKPQNWTAAREQEALERCSAALPERRHSTTRPKRLFGIRPYTREKPCYFRFVKPGLWVVTGGAKNGLIAAAWAARKIEEQL